MVDMDDIYWLAKAVRQQQAMLQKLLLWLPSEALAEADRKQLQDDLDKIGHCLAHLDTRVERG
jgi:hypothetical protein